MLSGTSWLLSPSSSCHIDPNDCFGSHHGCRFCSDSSIGLLSGVLSVLSAETIPSIFLQVFLPVWEYGARRPSLLCALSLWLAWRQCCVIWGLIRAPTTQLSLRFPKTDNRLLMWNINALTLSHSCSFYQGHSSSSVTEERPLYFWLCRLRVNFGQQWPGLALSGLSEAQQWVEKGWIRGMSPWCGPNNAASIHTVDKTQFSLI